MAKDEVVVFAYSTEQAVEDGDLVRLARIGKVPIFVTANCFDRLGFGDPVWSKRVVEQALVALDTADREDTPGRKLRELDVQREGGPCHRIWAILDGQGITLLFPEDY